MGRASKTLWIVDYDEIQPILDLAISLGATDLAIRTSSDVGAAIARSHDHGIRVHGWRWPSAQKAKAMAEANAAALLFGAGMDGYIVDPEGAPGKPYDWDQPGLESLAEDFCTRIVAAANKRPFGVTSYYRAKSVFPKLPWTQFFEQATVLLPQAYWRVQAGKVGAGDPAANFSAAIASWTTAGADGSLVVPIAGELLQVTADEIDHYVAAAVDASGAGHFYNYDSRVSEDVWAAIAAA